MNGINAKTKPSKTKSTLSFDGLPSTSMFNSTFTTREEELQVLLNEERKRSDQRRNNYNTLKSEHLHLQNEYLNLQTEMKQILEETMYFKEKKNNEVDELLKTIEDKGRQIEKLDKLLRDAEPEMIRLKCMDELEEPMRRIQKEKDRLEKDKDRLTNELKLIKQQLEHFEKEHLDSIDRIKLSYEAEINLIKCEKEEIRSRLVEASQSPDVKRLVDLCEENSRLNRKLQSTQLAIEHAELQYLEIQKKVEDFVCEQDEKTKLFEHKIQTVNNQNETLRQDEKRYKNDIFNLKTENEELLLEIGRLKRMQDKVKSDYSQQMIRLNEEKEELRIKLNQENKLVTQEKVFLTDEIKKLKKSLVDKEETIGSLEKMLSVKNVELNQQIHSLRGEDYDKIAKLEQQKKSLENSTKELLTEKQNLKAQIEKLRKQIDLFNEKRLNQEREEMLLRTRLDSQTISIEELEKVRRQHVVLHEEVNRLRSEAFDSSASNKELSRMIQNNKEEYNRLKDQLDEERRNSEELKIANEKCLTKMTRRYDEERDELRKKIGQLEAENDRLKARLKQTPDYCKNDDHSKMRAKQYMRIADRLNAVLEQLKTDSKLQQEANMSNGINTDTKLKLKTKPTKELDLADTTLLIPLEAHNHLKRELQKIKKRQFELEACINLSQCSIPAHKPTTSSK